MGISPDHRVSAKVGPGTQLRRTSWYKGAMTTLQPVVEATNRLAGFNDHREQILATVHKRIMNARLAAAAQGGDDSLEYVLNDVAFSEIRRLEKATGRHSQRELHRWRELANRLLGMSEAEKRSELDSLVHYYCEDIVGNFNPRVFRFASGVLPPAMSFLLTPVSGWRDVSWWRRAA